jgi:hypothetical protein
MCGSIGQKRLNAAVEARQASKAAGLDHRHDAPIQPARCDPVSVQARDSCSDEGHAARRLGNTGMDGELQTHGVSERPISERSLLEKRKELIPTFSRIYGQRWELFPD